MNKRTRRPRFRFPGGMLWALAAIALLTLLVPSAGPVGQQSDMLSAPVPTAVAPTQEPGPTPGAEPTEALTAAAATEAPDKPAETPVAASVPEGTPTPAATPEAAPVAADAPETTAPAETPVPVETPASGQTAAPAGTPLPGETAAPTGAAPVPTAEPAATEGPEPTPAWMPNFVIPEAPEEEDPARFIGEVFDPYGDGSMIVRLPMDDFSGGAALLAEGFVQKGDVMVYQDPSITVQVYQEKVNYTIYTVADVTVADASQLRTAIAGTPSSAARSRMTKLAERVNAVVAIDGDYYADRKGAYAVRQSTLLSSSLASDLDLLVIDYEGNFHGILAAEKAEALPQWEGQMYQCLCFGPVLIRDGQKIDYEPRYAFGLNYLNPRAGIGQVSDKHYMFVVASGRTEKSMSITAATLRDYMYEKGCRQAYNVDGGASAELVFAGKIASPLTKSGERGLYDIVYFASTAGMEAEE